MYLNHRRSSYKNRSCVRVNVATQFIEWDLFGIAISKQSNTDTINTGKGCTYVFLYYTASGGKPGVSAVAIFTNKN